MNFGSFGAGFGSFGAGVGGLLPSFTNITSWLKAPTADGKTLANSKGADATLTGVNCLNFDGVDDHIDLPTVPSDLLQGVFDVEFDILIDDSNTSYQRVLWLTTGTAFFRIQKNVNVNTFDFWARNSSNNTVFRDNNLAFTPDTIFNFRAVGDGTDVKVYYNDVLQTTISINASNKESGFAPSEPSLGSSSTSMKGKLSNFKLSSGGVLHTHLPIAEGSGTKAYDVSGNGIHGTITSATWTTADGIESWNHQYGHDLVGVLNGTVSGWDTNIGGDELDMYEIKMQSTADAGGDGNSYFVENSSTNPTLFMTNTNEGSGKRISFRVTSGSIEQMTGVSSADFNVYKVDYTNTSSVKVFVNGELELTSTQTVIPTTAHFHIGNDSAAGASDNGFFYYFKGWKDGVLKIHAVLDPSGRVRDLVSGNLLTADVGGTGSLGIKRIPALNTKTKQVATFDGVADLVNTGTSINATDVIECKFKYIGSTSADVVIFGNREGTNNLYFGLQGGNWRFAHSVSASGGVTDTGTVDNLIHTIVYNGDGTFTLDDTLNVDMSGESTPTITQNTYLGVRNLDNAPSKYSNLEIHSWKVTRGGSVLQEFNFQSDIGTATVQDLSTNNNDGTVTVGSGGTATFWGTRVADTAGSIVSADYATLNGTTFNNPLGFVHNGSECGVAMVTNSLTSTQLFAIDNSTATETFVRKDNGNIVQILDYSAPLTGDDLARTRSYVG